jgi:hypothetical protein
MPSEIGYGGFRRIFRAAGSPPHFIYIAGSKGLQNFEQWPKKSLSTESARTRTMLQH